MDAYSQLVRLLRPIAMQHGCIVEVDDRRGLNIVGITIRLAPDAKNPSPGELDWMDDELDGLTFEDALAYCRQAGLGHPE